MSEDRNTVRQVLWAFALLFFFLYLFIFHKFVKAFSFSDFFEAIDFISVFLTVLLFSSVLALFTALIPFKKKDYRRKLSYTFPASLLFVCLLFGSVFYFSEHRYDSLETPENTDCALVKNGTFKLDEYTIERNGNKQLEINTSTRKMKTFTVTWLSDCEYELRNDETAKRSGKIQVKIVAVDSLGYDCYAWSGTGSPVFCRLNRIRPIEKPDNKNP